MKKATNIHNLDTLNREIYRLRLEVKRKEDKLDDNWEYLQNNFPALLLNSISCRRKAKENGKENLFKSALKNEKLNTFIDKIIDRFSDRAAKGFDHLFEKIFHNR